ncbi:hypothetical protein HY490_04915 [Candidatus Woesearchaeota archaeon]|nr:hypothetical protein [Candidatus Woesearchaeota archaeon]
MERYGIPRRSVSAALTRKRKLPFTGNKIEKAFLIGLRAGDFYARRMKLCIRMQTSTTHKAQVSLLHAAFNNYGDTKQYVYAPNSGRPSEWFIYVDLHPSFDFLLHKPLDIPTWILHEDVAFWAFLAAYADCEGNWHVSLSHEKNFRCTFRLRTSDFNILRSIKHRLEKCGFQPRLYLDRLKGTTLGYGTLTNDFYALVVDRKTDIMRLMQVLLPHSLHSEKIEKMKFTVDCYRGVKQNWQEKWCDLRKNIEKEKISSNEQ